MRARNTREKRRDALLTAFILLVSFVVLSPLLLALLNSFKGLSEITHDVGSLPEAWRFDNYARAWSSLNFPLALWNSVVVTVLSNAGVVLISSMAAYRIVRHPSRGNQVLYKIFLSEMILPFQVVMIPLTIVLKKLGLINTTGGVVFAYLGMGVAMGVFTYCGFIKSIPRELEEAALMDGCSELRLFFHIVFPLLRPTTYTLVVINTFWFWNDFLLPLLVLSARELRTIPIAIDSLMGQYIMQWDLALPALMMAILPALIAFLFMQKNIVDGLTAGAVKS
jgi:raffinose/stachyose/melibiose transport system permease protein